jgi:1-acyl-sn-glycerol-3-phosphate acyltransferase
LAPFRPIAIDRNSGRRALQKLLNLGSHWLRNGRWVVIFPEGTRVAPGHRRSYSQGGAILASKTGYPVIPIAHNAGVFWHRRSFKKYPGEIDLIIGEQIDPRGLSAGEITRRVEEWIEATVAKLPKHH